MWKEARSPQEKMVGSLRKSAQESNMGLGKNLARKVVRIYVTKYARNAQKTWLKVCKESSNKQCKKVCKESSQEQGKKV